MSVEDQALAEVSEDLAHQQGPRPLTAKEIIAHPEFPYVTWLLTPTRRERVAVGRGRGGPFRISFEVHGKGPIKLVVSRSTVLQFSWFSFTSLDLEVQRTWRM
jgi:hypothetical protein